MDTPPTFLAQRWRAFITPADVPAIILYLSTGATYTPNSGLLTESPGAADLYTNIIPWMKKWPYHQPGAAINTLPITTEFPAVLDVIRVTNNAERIKGMFVSLAVSGYAASSSNTTTPPTLVLEPSRVLYGTGRAMLYTPYGNENTYLDSYREPSADRLMEPLGPLNLDVSGGYINWDEVADHPHVTITETPTPVAPRQAPDGHHYDNARHVPVTDPIWSAKPAAPGIDMAFDSASREAITCSLAVEVD